MYANLDRGIDYTSVLKSNYDSAELIVYIIS